MINNLTENRILNIEYRILNPRYWVRFFQHSTFNIQYSTRRGFTLIETMVALSVLLISVVGPISLIGNSLHNIYYARDQVVAINLAQEGVELVRRVRDTNKLSGDNWNKDLGVGCYEVDAGKIDGVSSDFVKYKGNIPCSVESIFNDTGTGTGLYRQGTGFPVASQFSRIVKIETIQNDIEMKVTSTVTWKTGNTAGTITVADHLFNLTAL